MLVRTVSAIFLLTFFLGCGSGGGGGSVPLGIGTGGARDGRVELRVLWPGVVSMGKLIPAAAEKMDVTVTGEGLSSPLIQTVLKSQVQNGQVTVSFSDVPVGNKTVEVRALSSAGVTVAHRKATFSVQENQTATVTTELGVTIGDGSFTPSEFTLSKGEVLLWVNGGAQTHSVVADESGVGPRGKLQHECPESESRNAKANKTLFDSGTLAPGTSFSWTAATPGSYLVRCGIHPDERSELLVNFSPPALAGLSPVTGPSGIALTINGSDFGALQLSSNVTIGGVTAPILSWSDSQITCTVPPGTGVTDGSVRLRVAGTESNSAKFVVTPSEEWTRTYNSPGNSNDQGYGITVDGSGNVYVTGSEDRADLGQEYDALVLKHDANGNILWARFYNGPAQGTDEGTDIAVDGSGNVYAAGYNSAPGVWNDVWVRKYAPNGNTVWTQTYNSPANNVDVGRGIAVDASGAAYVTGYVLRQDIGQDYNIWLQRYDGSGSPSWNQTYNNFQNRQDQGFGVALNASGFIWVAGSENLLGQSDNIWVRKYDANGNPVWTQTYNDTANGQDVGLDIAVDSSGNAYVTGFETLPGQGGNVWVRKYDANGNPIWTRTYNDPANAGDSGRAIAVDSFGNVYVAGHETSTDGGQNLNIWLCKYDPDGNILWTQTYNSPANANDSGEDIHVDSSGYVYVAGYETRADLGQARNVWVRKYKQ
ncbi:MAG: SBBP repeat-containing protein [Armatimonadetes bacterium]|nr:SBBP repeat-containing protein [Armatimonadota bacterium]